MEGTEAELYEVEDDTTEEDKLPDLPAKPPRKPRRKHDAYPTVDDLAKAIVKRVGEVCSSPERIVEPTAGEGPFVKALRQRYGSEPQIVAVDIVADYLEKCMYAGATKFIQSDFLAIPDVALAKVDLIVGNPPFNTAAAIVRKCVRAAPHALIAFLLPVGFLGATKTDTKGLRRDAAFWRECPIQYVAALHPRPSFTGDGKTDRMEYALLGFGEEWSNLLDGRRIGDPIVWRPE